MATGSSATAGVAGARAARLTFVRWLLGGSAGESKAACVVDELKMAGPAELEAGALLEREGRWGTATAAAREKRKEGGASGTMLARSDSAAEGDVDVGDSGVGDRRPASVMSVVSIASESSSLSWLSIEASLSTSASVAAISHAYG
jgi:hypothetical protein